MNKNPNNCATCDHKQHPDGGWCYMFRNEPDDVCFSHTARNRLDFSADAIFKIMLAVIPHQGPTQ
jgi:hypothetical protein